MVLSYPLSKVKKFVTKKNILIFLGVCASCLLVFLLYEKLRKTSSLSLQSQSWNTQRADYLARRVYLDPTNADISLLSQAGSKEKAVSLLFATVSPDEQKAFQAGRQNLIQKKSTYKNQTAFENTLYAYDLIHDPDRVRRKLYYLWENIFSVDAPDAGKKITLDDGKILHSLLYDQTLGNYISLVDAVEHNYAMAQYLDLTASRPKNPNENFARELMQLFLIGQYTPLDSQKTVPNYTDQDVNNLAYILTGFTADATNRTVTYEEKNHYTQPETLFGESINDPEHMISYIVSKKQTETALFLSDKLLRYYVSDTPAPEDIRTFSRIIIQNNFAVSPSLQWLFSSELFYNPVYMQQERYKMPIELVSSFYTLLYGRTNYAIIPQAQLLSDLDFQPYRPGSIFGRDGFTSNILFYSGTILNRWISDTDRLLRTTPLTTALQQNLLSTKGSDSPEGFIQNIASHLYVGRTLPVSVQDILKKYLLTDSQGNAVPFAVSATEFSKLKLPGLLGLLFIQPEFLLQSGTMEKAAIPSSLSQTSPVTQSLIVVRLFGGLDYQGLVANTQDPSYAANRKQMALTPQNSTPVGKGYMLNNAVDSLLPVIASKEAFFVSSVGLPGHSRAHDIAGMQMETGLNPNQEGILALLGQNVPNANMISFTNTPPLMLKGVTSLQIGSSNLTLYQKNKANPRIQQDTLQREELAKQIFSGRKVPEKISPYYSQALLLDSLAQENIAKGGKGTAGSDNKTQFTFLSQLIADHIGSVYYLKGDGGYDNHAHEDLVLDKELTPLFGTIVSFFNQQKLKSKLTIVVFSEFGRTNKINGSNGTDHGQAGGMIVLSNVLHWPEMTGSITPSKDAKNWMTVQVDERDVWNSIFTSVFGLKQPVLNGRKTTLSDYPVTLPY